MKTVFLHGLGQTAQDWKEVVQQLSISESDPRYSSRRYSSVGR